MAKARKKIAPNEVNPKKAEPEIIGAFICDRILVEKDDVLSAVRIVDQAGIALPANVQQAAILGLDLTLVFIFKSAKARGPREFTLLLENPSGVVEQIGRMTLDFKEPDNGGHNIQVPIRFKWDKEGGYWFHLQTQGQTRVRTPLFIRLEDTEAKRAKPGQLREV